MAKNFIFTMFVFLFFALVASAGAQTTADVQDCSGPGLDYCQQSVFMDTDQDEMTFVFVQQAVIDANPRVIASDVFVDIYLEGLNAEASIFVPNKDVTDEQEADFLKDAEAFLVKEGTSDLLEDGQDATMVVVADEGFTYIFISVGESDNFLEFIEDTIEDELIENVPDNYMPIPLDSSL